MLNGWKTYIVAAAAIVYAGYGVFTGQFDANHALEIVFGAAGLGALRHGVSKS